ncbi:caspase family protein [Myxococcota bacterium]|nr:caspase family protein [Myxococcota bacterium]
MLRSSSVAAFALTFVVAPGRGRAEGLEPIVQGGHSGAVTRIVASDDGVLVASGGEDGVVKLWETERGLEVASLRGHAGGVGAIAFVPGQRRLVTGDRKGLLRLWSLDDGRELARWIAADPINRLVVRPDGGGFVSESSAVLGSQACLEARAFEGSGAPTWRVYVSAPWSSYRGLAFSPDGAAIAWAHGGAVHVLEATSGRERATLPVDHLLAFRDAASLWVSAGGQLAVANLSDGAIVQRLAVPTPSAIDPSQRFGATTAKFSGTPGDVGHRRTIELWDLGSAARVATFSCAAPDVFDRMALTTGGLAVASTELGRLHFFERSTGRTLASVESRRAGIDAAMLTADGRLLAIRDRTASGGAPTAGRIVEAKLSLWSVGRGGPRPVPGRWETFGDHFVAAGIAVLQPADAAGARVFDVTTGRALGAVAGAQTWPVAISADGKLFATRRMQRDGSDVQIWTTDRAKARGKKVLIVSNDPRAVFSPDGRVLAAYTKSAVTFIDTTTGKVTASHELAGLRDYTTIGHCAFTASGALGCGVHSTYDRGKDRLAIVEGGAVRVAPMPGLEQGPFVLSSDGRLLASQGGLWDVATGARLWSAAARPFGFDAADARLLTVDTDGAIVLRRVRDGAVLLRVYALGDADWVAATPDGRFDGTDAGIERVHFAPSLRPVPLASLFERLYTPRLVEQVLGAPVDAPVPAAATLAPPPRVVITTPADGTTTDADTIEVSVEVDASSAIEELRLHQNGKLVEEDTRGLKRIGREKRVFSVTLLSGKNVLRAVAFTRDRTEGAAEITVTRSGAEPKADLFVVAIGINEYENPRYRLGFGRPDAESFVKLVGAGGAKMFRRVVKQELYDRDAGRGAIFAALAKVAAEARAEDVFVLYYAGHGVSEESSSDYYLVPPDVTQLYGDPAQLRERAVSAGALKAEVAKIRARKQLILLDACESGGAVAAFAMRGAAEEKAIHQLARSAGTAVLASTGNSQLAAEVTKLGHGAFTYAVLEALKGKADGAPRDGKVTVKELEAFIEERLPELTREHRGTPQYPNAFTVGQDFPIVLSP